MKISYDSTLGAAFCGFAASGVLYGVLCSQIYVYMERYREDRLVYKILVFFIWLTETFHQALVAYTLYYYTITNFSNPLALLYPVWPVIIQVGVGGVISTTVRSCFAMRVWRFSRHNIYITGVIVTLIVAQFVLALVATVRFLEMKTFLDIHQLQVIVSVTLGISVLSDTVIAAALIYYLHHLKTGLPAANSLVNGLIRYSVETGALTSICSICTLVSFDVLPESFIYMSFYFVLSKLYSNSFLATLNTRKVVRGRGLTDQGRGADDNFTIIQTTVRSTHIALSDLSPFETQVKSPLPLSPTTTTPTATYASGW